MPLDGGDIAAGDRAGKSFNLFSRGDVRGSSGQQRG
jgi:hypothetical protein